MCFKSNLYLNYANREKVDYKLPNGCPQLVFQEIRGKKVLDSISKARQDEFLEMEVNKFILQNNLAYIKETDSVEDSDYVAPLTAEEAKELSKLKKETKVISSGDDFFDNL